MVKRKVISSRIVYKSTQEYRINHPSQIDFTGKLIWYKDVLHRHTNKPACYFPNGYVQFWKDGEFVRSCWST